MPSATVAKLGLLLSSSPLQLEELTKAMTENQNQLGIVSILRSDHAHSNMATTTTNTLRRNLSADMSSRKWLAQNGFSSSSSMKKIASSEQLSSLEDEINSRPVQDDVWMSIQLNNNNNNKKEVEKPDTWGSILSQNAKEDHHQHPIPYVHPLVKRSSSLSEKSLQICTESLGSETGSEEFSSYPSSESTTSSDTEDQNKEEQQQKQSVVVDSCGREEWQATKCMYSTRSSTSTRSFPPPLSSLPQSAGPTLHMQSRRLHGRLVLEAVSVPSQNFFQAQRQDGRLVLKLNSNQNQNQEEDEEEEVEEIVRQETKVKEVTVLMEQEPRLLTSGGTIMFNKIMRIDNVNPTWPNRFNREINLSRVKLEVELDQEEEEEDATTAQSLPHLARLIRSPAATTTTTVGTTGSFNAYDYFWRTKPTNNQQSPTEKNNKLTITHNSPKACERQELVFLRGNKGEYLVPLVTGCKDSRRSLLIWEPYCIATS